MSNVAVKICGLRDVETALCAARAGADYLGFVFFRKSPRDISAEAAEELISAVKQASEEEGFALPGRVGLFVDAGERELAEAAHFLTQFQFHGRESPERCAEMGVEFAMDVIKALPIASADDIARASEYAEAADMMLFDARPPGDAKRPGGHGVAFDWSLLEAYQSATPYLLAGGLTPENVAEAVGAPKSDAFAGVDVSSGVESAMGVKDNGLIERFIAAAKNAAK